MGSTPVRAVIFDHDGTLVDSENITLSIVAQIAVEAGAEVFPDDVDRFVGSDLHLVFEEIERRAATPLPSDIFDQFRARQNAEIKRGLQPIAGAASLLSQLTHQVAVASNAPVAKMELCLGVTDLLQFFPGERLFSAYDVEAWKPDPAVFLRAAEVLDIDPRQCAVIEDSEPGILGAKAAGMQVFALDPKARFANIEGVISIEGLLDVLAYL